MLRQERSGDPLRSTAYQVTKFRRIPALDRDFEGSGRKTNFQFRGAKRLDDPAFGNCAALATVDNPVKLGL